MKYAITAATLALANAQNTPVTGSWAINCQTTTSPNDEAGPMYVSTQPNSNGGLNMFWSAFSRGYGAISGSGPYGTGNGGFCDSADNSSFTEIVQTDIFDWPNAVDAVPNSVFYGDGFFTVADGFASTAAHDGCIAIVNTNSNIPATLDDIQFLTNGCGQGNLLQTKYYYKQVQWFDMDGDGDLDLVTARASSLRDPTDLDESALVWLQNPGNGFSPTARTWKDYEITASENIAESTFAMTSYNGNTYAIAGGFSSGTLILLSGPNWAAASNIQATTIATGNPYYVDTCFGDLNQDGIPDAITAIGSYGNGNGRLVVYPGQDQSGSLTFSSNVTVYDQFPEFNSESLGSPSSACQFFYSQAQQAAGQVPSILVSGGADGYLYMADPTDSDPANFNWSYETNVIYKTSNFNPFVTPFTAPTVGKPAVTDVNGDGCTDIVVAGYSLQQLVFLEQKNTRNCN